MHQWVSSRLRREGSGLLAPCNPTVQPMGEWVCSVPMVVKDFIQELAEEPLHEGMQYLRDFDYRPPATTELARRFEAAGLVICAKTNTPELGASQQPSHSPTGRPRTLGISPAPREVRVAGLAHA